FEIAVPAVINGEKEFGGAGNIHGAEYKGERRLRKLPERRSRDARSVRALRSLPCSPPAHYDSYQRL
ncbi:hypothetical protein, partial [Candidatus Erwinia dacicola]|uniref:hypothetical protein n=1 Tax=Candidatus Erwinia dacicola TaxID=252393 RepID=UPI001C9CD044